MDMRAHLPELVELHRLDVVPLDGDVVVAVRPTVLVLATQHVQQLVNDKPWQLCEDDVRLRTS